MSNKVRNPVTFFQNVTFNTAATIAAASVPTTILGTTGTGGTVYAEPLKPKYWYRFIHYECPLCGSIETIKERVYDEPKPEDSTERHIDVASACGFHFT